MMGALVISAYDRDGYNSLPKWIIAVGEQFGMEQIVCCVIRSWEYSHMVACEGWIVGQFSGE